MGQAMDIREAAGAELSFDLLAALRPATSIRSRVIRRGGGIDVSIITCVTTAD
jgi:hypothetical protein